jgi:hypothetical protein
MGEQFLSRQTKRFRHRTDEAYKKELQTPHLFSNRDEIFTSKYPCISTAGNESVVVGDEVIVRSGNGGELSVLRGPIVIGMVEEPASKALREIMKSTPNCAGMMIARVVEKARIGGGFKIVCTEEQVN